MTDLTFNMPVLLMGAISFQPETGGKINQLYSMNVDPSNPIYKGFVHSKISCDQAVFDQLPTDPSAYPKQFTLIVRNKSSAGKTIQHAVGIVPESAKPSK